MIFVQLVVQEKSGGQFDGTSPDYRAFLYYKFDEDRFNEDPYSTLELRGYGQTGADAAADAWNRYTMVCEEND